MQEMEYKAWFEKYRPMVFEDIVFPNKDIKMVLKGFYEQGFINGNVISYGPPGFGKTTLSEVMIHRIVKDVNDIFILGRKTEDVDKLRRWLMQRATHSKQKIVKIEEMDRLSSQAQTVLKDGLMEKFQDTTCFLATTNSPEKIDPAIITRFNTKINFGELPPDDIYPRLAYILGNENIIFKEEDLRSFVTDYSKRGLRDLINNLELASTSGTFNTEILNSFVGSSGSEDLIKQYIVYLIQYIEGLDIEAIINISKDPKSDSQFFTYYDYALSVFKNELRLNWHAIYDELSKSDLDMSAKNIVNSYWQDLELKRFKHTHTISLIHELVLNVIKLKGG